MAAIPEESADWLKVLGSELDNRKVALQLYDDYYEGQHGLLFATKKFKNAFGNLFREFADNFCEVVVDSVEERLNVEGFRFGATEDQEADKDAWEIWQRNAMDAESQILHTESLVKAHSYNLVWADEQGNAEITVEDAFQMIVRYAKGNHRQKLVAMKRWEDESGFLFATLYFPDRVEKFKSQSKYKAGQMAQATSWEVREEKGEDWPLKNPLGEVPVVPYVNRKRLGGVGRSEIHSVIGNQNAINKLCADMLVAAEYGAFPQRWATGIEVPLDKAGNPIAPFDVAMDKMLTNKSTEGKFGSFDVVDLETFVKAIAQRVQHLATQSRTPPHYFLASMGNFPSGESLKSAETGLVAKVKRKMRHFGESHEETMRLAFKVEGDPRGNVRDAETIWRDPESRTASEHIDSLVKQQALGVPNEILWEKAGYSPQEIARMKRLKLETDFLADEEPGESPAA